MRIACLILLVVCVVSGTVAQNSNVLPPDTLVTDEIFFAVNDQAQFVGGYDSLAKFLRANIRYPVEARKKNIQGKVFVKFIVEKNGAISSLEVLKGITPELDQEAIRVISLSPLWIPGRHGGKVVRSSFVLPINFLLSR